MRYYSSSAVATTLASGITDSATSIAVGSVSGFPIQYPYTLSIDANGVDKELVEVTNAAGTTLTVTRGVDGTSAVAHSLGAPVTHDHSARDFRESRDHEEATAAHGATGAVVGTTNSQTLTNKTLASPAITGTPTGLTKAHVGLANVDNTSDADKPVSTAAQAALDDKADADTAVTLAGSETLTNKNLTSGTNTFPTSLATLTGAQTVTNKNLTSGTNTFPTSLATLTGVQVLTNKDLSSPTNTFPATLATNAEVTAEIAAAIAAIEVPDPTWVAVTPSMGAVWDTPTDWQKKDHGADLITLKGQFLRDGSALTATSTGNIADTIIATGLPAPSYDVPVSVVRTEFGQVWSGWLTTAGILQLLAGYPDGEIPNNASMYFSVTYAKAP